MNEIIVSILLPVSTIFLITIFSFGAWSLLDIAYCNKLYVLEKVILIGAILTGLVFIVAVMITFGDMFDAHRQLLSF